MLETKVGGRYEIVKFLGRGGFAETYLAKDAQMPFNPACVVKKLKPQTTDAATLQAARVLFDREAQVLYQLGNHDQIPRLLAHFEENLEFYLVEDFVDGEDLEKEFATSQPWTEAQVIDLLEQVLGILAFVHQHNVIHRDVKPSNLIKRKLDGKFVLLDFGAVKQVHTQVVTAGGHTSVVLSIGTNGYMPNEQHGGKPRFSSDIYALGMTAIHALTGRPPDELPEDPRTGEVVWRPHAQVSHRLAAILDKMVRAHYADRYETVEDVLNDLQKIHFRVPQPDPPDRWWQKSLLSLQTSVRQWRQSLKPRYFLIVLAAVGVTFGVSQIFRSECSQPDVCIKEGRELMHSSEYKKALAKFNKVPTDKLDDAEAAQTWVGRGAALYFLEQYKEALSAFEKAAKLNPNNAEVWEGQGRTLYELDRNEEAVTAFDKAIALNSDNFSLWNLRGEALAELKRFNEALASWEKATQLKPENPQVWYKRGFALYKLERYSEALYSFEEAIKNKLDYADAWFGKGRTLEQLERYDEAIAAYDKVIELKPDFQEAKEARQQAMEKQGG